MSGQVPHVGALGFEAEQVLDNILSWPSGSISSLVLLVGALGLLRLWPEIVGATLAIDTLRLARVAHRREANLASHLGRRVHVHIDWDA